MENSSEGEETQEARGNFDGLMGMFLTEYETIKIDEERVLASVKEVTKYFHGESVKEGYSTLQESLLL